MRFESPIEERWFNALLPHLAGDVRLVTQVEVGTHRGQFRIDMVAFGPEGRVAFECDGAEFHDPHRDEWRDACILGDGQVEDVYRLRGEDINFRLDDLLFVVARWSPELFTKRGLHVIECAASGTASEWMAKTDGRHAIWSYADRQYVNVERRSSRFERQFWRELYAKSKALGPMSLDHMLAIVDTEPWP